MTEPRLRAIVSALVAAIAALAFLVSFRAISEFAIQTGAFPARLGWAAPLLVDSFTLAASIEVLRSALAAQRAVYPWCLVAASTLASAALNIAHAPEDPAAQAVAGIPPVALLLALELLMRGARLYLRVQGVDTAPEPDTARERLRAWLAINPSTSLTAREAAELLGVSRSRAGALLQQERAGATAIKASSDDQGCPARRHRSRREAEPSCRSPCTQPGGGAPHARGADRPRLRRRVREPCARTRAAASRPGDTGRPGRAMNAARPAGKRRGPWRTTQEPPPPPAPADPPDQEGGSSPPDRMTAATNPPVPSRAPRRGHQMPDTHVTIAGNLTDDPEVSFTPNGAAVTNFRLAVTARIKDGEGWRDGDTSFYRITAWRQLAEHIGDSLSKGHRVIVLGQLRARSWETPEGERRTVVEVQAEEVGPSLRWATAKPERATNGKPSKGEFNDDPSF